MTIARHRRGFTLIELIATFSLVLVTATDADDTKVDAESIATVVDRMQSFVDDRTLSGAVTLVAHEGNVVHLEAVGQADLANKRQMTTDSVFRIASMTKPITATAVLILQDEGKLSVDDRVDKYLPNFAAMRIKGGGESRPIRIRDLMTHTAGLSRPPRNQKFESLAAYVDAIAERELQFEPGDRWQYSVGLNVAGRIIEIVAEKPFEQFLKERIFEPLGMEDTAFRLTEEQASRYSPIYDRKDDLLVPTEHSFGSTSPTDSEFPNPSGGLCSTAGDMYRFYQMILNGGEIDGQRIVSDSAVRQMTTLSTGHLRTGFTPGNGWGLGWCMVRDPQGVSSMLSPGTFGHGGAFGTQGWIDRDRRTIYVLMIARTGLPNADDSTIREHFQQAASSALRDKEFEGAKFIDKYGDPNTIELSNESTRVVLCPDAGGRVLEYSLDGTNSLFVDENDRGDGEGGRPMSAGRFDIGPEKVIPGRPTLWSGPWSAELIGPRCARLVSLRDDATGVQLTREFRLDEESSRLSCTQIIRNVSKEPNQWCHWSRTFAVGNGIGIVPLTKNSRFPLGYVQYEGGDRINIRPEDPNIRERDGFLEIFDVPQHPKLGFDSTAGWFAYAAPNDLLFVKRFRIYPSRVYNEAAGLTISIWYPEDRRVELEPIGPAENLDPGEAASFTEEWELFPFEFPQDRQALDLKAVEKLAK